MYFCKFKNKTRNWIDTIRSLVFIKKSTYKTKAKNEIQIILVLTFDLKIETWICYLIQENHDFFGLVGIPKEKNIILMAMSRT